MNLWLIASGVLAAIAAIGHAVPGARMFYRPILANLEDAQLRAIFTGIWHLITVHFTLSGLAMIIGGIAGTGRLAVWLVALQFALYAVIYLTLSLRLGGLGKLFQWLPFGAVAATALIGLLAI
jgi:hypothetical protein